MANAKLTKKDIETIKARYRWGQSGAQIGRDYGLSGDMIRCHLRRAGMTLRRKGWSKHEHHIYFENIDCEEKAYILGIFYADGCNTRAGIVLRLAEQDKQLLIKIRDCICPELKLRRINPRGNSRQVQWALGIYGEALQDRLTELGCFPKKSLILRFPQWLSPNFIRDFIRGYMDGDGCISISKRGHPRLAFVGTTSLLSSIREIINKQLGIDGGLYRRNKLDLFSICDLQYNGFNKVLPVLRWLYNDATIYMERKFQKYLEASKGGEKHD